MLSIPHGNDRNWRYKFFFIKLSSLCDFIGPFEVTEWNPSGKDPIFPPFHDSDLLIRVSADVFIFFVMS